MLKYSHRTQEILMLISDKRPFLKVTNTVSGEHYILHPLPKVINDTSETKLETNNKYLTPWLCFVHKKKHNS